MLRIVWFLPALAALLVAVVLMFLGQHNPVIRMLGLAVVGASLGLSRYAQRRAPPPKHAVSTSLIFGLLGAIFLATLLMIVVAPLVSH